MVGCSRASDRTVWEGRKESSGSPWSRAKATKSARAKKDGCATGEAPRLVSGRSDLYSVCDSLPGELDIILLFFGITVSVLLLNSEELVERLFLSEYL